MPLLLIAATAFASPAGKTGVAASGCTCHGNASAEVQVLLSADTTAIEPGEPVTLQLWVSHPEGVASGLDVDAAGGRFTAGADTQVRNDEITHLEPTALVDSAYTYTFSWTADADGDYRIYAAGMATDGNGRDQGDWWTFADDLTIVVGDGGALPDTGDTGEGEDTGDTGEAPPDCGCQGGGAAPTVAAVAVAALLLRRRRA